MGVASDAEIRRAMFEGKPVEELLSGAPTAEPTDNAAAPDDPADPDEPAPEPETFADADDLHEDVQAKEFVRKGRKVREGLKPAQAQAFKEYSESGYRAVNALLRNTPGRRAEHDEHFSKVASELTTALDEQVAAGNNTPGVVYRQRAQP
jgi:hypothetical protein